MALLWCITTRMNESSICFCPYKHRIVRFSILGNPTWSAVGSHCGFHCFSFVTNHVELLSCAYLLLVVFFVEVVDR